MLTTPSAHPTADPTTGQPSATVFKELREAEVGYVHGMAKADRDDATSEPHWPAHGEDVRATTTSCVERGSNPVAVGKKVCVMGPRLMSAAVGSPIQHSRCMRRADVGIEGR